MIFIHKSFLFTWYMIHLFSHNWWFTWIWTHWSFIFTWFFHTILFISHDSRSIYFQVNWHTNHFISRDFFYTQFFYHTIHDSFISTWILTHKSFNFMWFLHTILIFSRFIYFQVIFDMNHFVHVIFAPDSFSHLIFYTWFFYFHMIFNTWII